MQLIRPVLKEFEENFNVPLAAELAIFLAENGFPSQAKGDLFDYHVYDQFGERIAAVKTVQSFLSKPLRRNLALADTPNKILLVENPNTGLEWWIDAAMGLAHLGIFVYLRDYGWTFAPRELKVLDPLEARLQRAKRWYRIEETWYKTCTKCHLSKQPHEFYDNPRPTATDPKRNICIECSKAARK